jgi:tRNA nucleotidyltransferase (CCA-adding enzyme)
MVENDKLNHLPKERIFKEFNKILLKSEKPSIGFNLMLELGILEKHFKEIYDLVGVEQSPIWHPEGDVYKHTMMSLDEMANLTKGFDDDYRLALMYSILCHDLGKVTHTTNVDGKISAYGHEEASLEPTKTFMKKLTNSKMLDKMLPLIEHHLKPSQFYHSVAKSKAIRRLAKKVNIRDLVLLSKADFLGRTTPESLTRNYKAGDWLLKKAKELEVLNSSPIYRINGKELIKMGFKPSKIFRDILNLSNEMEDDGVEIDEIEKAILERFNPKQL